MGLFHTIASSKLDPIPC